LIVKRERKSAFVRLFDKTPPDVVCPHFYELILSNGCPFDCVYCYLKLTFRGRSHPTLFCNAWSQVEEELEAVPSGVFSTGELADSLAIPPPLLRPALDYFSAQKPRYLLLLTKSTNLRPLYRRSPSPQVVVSFSVNSPSAARQWERGVPPPDARLRAAARVKKAGWRLRIRIDPVILESGLEGYKPICEKVAELEPEVVTVGTLRQYPGLFRFSPEAPRKGLTRAPDGRMRYAVEERTKAYETIRKWLGFQPALCKETREVWHELGWTFYGCNCTENPKGASRGKRRGRAK